MAPTDEIEHEESSSSNILIPERVKGSPFAGKLVLFVEFFERICYYSVIANIVLFCISFLNFSKLNSLLATLIFIGFSYFLSIFGCWIADSCSGKYNAVFTSILFYITGSGSLLAISYFKERRNKLNTTFSYIFITSLVVIAIGAAGIKSNLSTFAARQAAPFGEHNVRSLFNWFYWLINLASLLSYTVIAYLQLEDFFYGYIPGVSGVVLSAFVLLCFQKCFIYRPPDGSYLSDVMRMVQHAIKRRVKFGSSLRQELPRNTSLDFLEYAHVMYGGSYSTEQLDMVRCLGRITLVFTTLVVYWAIYFQMPSLFLLQSYHFDLNISNFRFPGAAMNLFDTISILLVVRFMEMFIYPCCRFFNLNFTTLRRMGFGLFLAALAMIYAALLEPHRRNNVDFKKTNVILNTTFHCSNMTVFWQVPQFALIGISEFFTSISGLEFAYSQSPRFLQGVVMALFLSTSGLGALLAAIIIKVTSMYTNWICENINNCQLEYYFYLMAGLCVFNLMIFMCIACCYSYAVSYGDNTPALSRGFSTDTRASATDISDIFDAAEQFYENRASSNIDLSRDPSFHDATSEDEMEKKT